MVGQVQHGVGGIQVAGTVGAEGAAGHLDGAEHGGQLAVVAGFDLAVADAVGVDGGHLLAGGVGVADGVLLAHGPQVQVVLVQQPQRLPALNVKVVLELVVGPAGRLGTGEGGHQGFEGATGGGEGVEAFSRQPASAPGLLRGLVGRRRLASGSFWSVRS